MKKEHFDPITTGSLQGGKVASNLLNGLPQVHGACSMSGKINAGDIAETVWLLPGEVVAFPVLSVGRAIYQRDFDQ